jgi:hypothetical protein
LILGGGRDVEFLEGSTIVVLVEVAVALRQLTNSAQHGRCWELPRREASCAAGVE